MSRHRCRSVNLYTHRVNLHSCRSSPSVLFTIAKTQNIALAAQLTTQYDDFQASAPPAVRDPIITAKSKFNASFDPSQVIKPGDRFPHFSLPDATGRTISSTSLLADSNSLLVTFYRGEWCPFCNLALVALQKQVPEYRKLGAQSVAISPELPNGGLTIVQKHNLDFPVLSDVGNSHARQLGIVFRQDESLKVPLATIGTDFKERNGDDSFEVPVPITLLVGEDGIVKNVYLDPDFTKRLEPETVVEWIKALNQS